MAIGPGSFIDRNPGGFLNDDTLISYMDQCICGPQVNTDIQGKKSHQPVKGLNAKFSSSS